MNNVESVLAALGYPLFLFLLWHVGSWFCQRVLKTSGLSDAPEVAKRKSASSEREREQQVKAGRLIGVLERTLIAVGIVAMRWEVIAGVIALKSVSRYKELEEKLNAEYFLIGSLTSLAWAGCLTLCFIAYDTVFGFRLVSHLREMLTGTVASYP